MPRPRPACTTRRCLSLLQHGAWLAIGLLAPTARADDADTKAKPDPPEKSYLIPAAEIIGFDFLLSHFNKHFSGVSDYDVTLHSIRDNLHGPWVVDNDPFKINQFAHPYQGSLYHNAARSTGLNYWEASAYTFAGSVAWEIAGEKTPPSKNDQVASGIAGSFLGEPLFRMAHLVLEGRGPMSDFWREASAAAVSPAVGFNRLVYGSRFDDSFHDHEPMYYGRLRVGASHALRDDIGNSGDFKKTQAEIDYAMDYGLPGKEGYDYRRPFDYFGFEVGASSANGVELLSTRGLLVGNGYAAGDNVRGLWGLYGNYDYLAPSIFHLSSTGLSVGSTAQWWLSSQTAVQGTALAGLGYSAASTLRGVTNDRDYHYGMAPRFSLALRLIASERAVADFSAQRYLLGRIANRSAGRDDIERADASVTWRVAGRHGIGVNYNWSHRVADFPTSGERKQTLGMVGVYYTLLAEQGLGAVEWRKQPGE